MNPVDPITLGCIRWWFCAMTIITFMVANAGSEREPRRGFRVLALILALLFIGTFFPIPYYTLTPR